MKLRTRRRILKRLKTTKQYKKESFLRLIEKHLLASPLVRSVLKFLAISRGWKLDRIVIFPRKRNETEKKDV